MKKIYATTSVLAIFMIHGTVSSMIPDKASMELFTRTTHEIVDAISNIAPEVGIAGIGTLTAASGIMLAYNSVEQATREKARRAKLRYALVKLAAGATFVGGGVLAILRCRAICDYFRTPQATPPTTS